VPVGVLLSGGLDSSLITAMAARSSARVRTFTVAFPGHPSHDESRHARLVASHFHTDHTELPAASAVVDVLPVLARQFDEPIADSAIVPSFLLSKAIRQEASVALGGEGGDELFGGYPHYQWVIGLSHARKLVPGSLRGLVARAGRAMPAGARGRHHLSGLRGDIGESIAHINLYCDAPLRASLLRPLGPPVSGEQSPEAWRAGLDCAIDDPRERAMRADFHSTLVDGYLVRVDRASMLASLELRAPFLDHRLVEFAMGEVPPDQKVTRRSRKILLRALAGRVLPPALDLHRKQGLTMPLRAWFAAGWADRCAEVLRSSADLLDARAVRSLLAGQRAGRANHERLFALTMLALWRSEYRIGL
jgi:asparagine synthase (glutamine-hydrolysing)